MVLGWWLFVVALGVPHGIARAVLCYMALFGYPAALGYGLMRYYKADFEKSAQEKMFEDYA